MAEPAPPGRLRSLIRKYAPSRARLARNRFVKPFARRVLRGDLWRFTRRSVPRGAALGMIVGIFVMIPGLQMAAAALLALPFRANVPIAALATINSNPLTTPFILLGAIFVGNNVFGLDANPERFRTMIAEHASIAEWLHWFASDAAPALIGGLLVVAAVAGVITYIAVKWAWRFWIARKWRRRRLRRAPATIAQAG